jgi:hypothetical protein
VVTSNEEAGVSGWQEESRGDSIESMDIGLGNDTEVRVGQMVSALFVEEVDDDDVDDDDDDEDVVVLMVERSKTVSGVSPGYFWR